jgi:hypothetical protein
MKIRAVAHEVAISMRLPNGETVYLDLAPECVSDVEVLEEQPEGATAPDAKVTRTYAVRVSVLGPQECGPDCGCRTETREEGGQA